MLNLFMCPKFYVSISKSIFLSSIIIIDKYIKLLIFTFIKLCMKYECSRVDKGILSYKFKLNNTIFFLFFHHL